MLNWTRAIPASLCALALAAVIGCGEPSESILVDGLASPRGLTALEDGRLLLAELGAGRLLIVSPEGDVAVHADLLPRLADGPEGAPTGVSAALLDGDTTYYIVGEARAKEFREIYALEPGEPPRGITGQDVMGTGPTNALLNMYDLERLPSGDLLVSDAGANAVFRVTLEGEIALYSDPGTIPYTLPEGSGEAEPVPTGMAIGPDGAVYLATLTGAPFPEGGARVFRMLDGNGDGDALDAGETTLYAVGFTTATDVAFLPDGSMVVTEYTTSMAELAGKGYAHSAEHPGRLVRWDNGARTVLADDLVSPTSVVALDGKVYVSEEFAGRVRIIEP
jgi:hypothetical protein